jgi:hypothetical protein
MTNSVYDFREHRELVALCERFADALSTDRKSDLQLWCDKNTLKENLQVPPFNTLTAETMTLGELADIGKNDPGAQRIDVRSIEGLGFGPQGIVKPQKSPGDESSSYRLLDFPKVIYLQRGDEAPSHPANASGRHRNYFIQMLLHAAGVAWEDAMEQELWVIKQVCRSHSEFGASMLVANAGGNGPRKQPPVEKLGYGLTTIGIDISTVSTLIATYQGLAKVSHYPDVFGMAVALAAIEAHETTDVSRVFDVAKRAFNFAYKASGDNRSGVKRVFVTEPALLRDTVVRLAEALPGIEDAVSHEASPIPAKTRMAEQLSDELASLWSLLPRDHAETAEVAKAKIEALESSIETLKPFTKK